MSNVFKMTIPEVVLLNSDKMVELCVKLGEAGAEAKVSQTMENLAYGVGKVEDAYIEQDLKKLTEHMKDLVTLAESIGMSTFVEVAGDVISCARGAQIVPLAATLCRLMRIADKSINAVYNMGDVRV